VAQVQTLGDPGKVPTTKLEDDKASSCVVLPAKKGDRGAAPRYFLGRACAKPDCSTGTFTGRDTSSAKATFSQGQGYVVDLKLKSSGHDKINQLAGAAFGQPPPQNAMAIVLDGVVQSAPAFRTSNFPGDVEISGNFSRTEASDLARLLNYGALPVQLKQLTTQNVSPTLGKDQLRSGIAAGLVGLALVALYMLFYYRVLGLVVFAGLGLSAAATYALISYLSNSINLALTLAGVTGLIVSVGVTVDSYVVYFERLKDEVRSGKTVRSSVERGFTRAFRTIVAADLVSLIGALVLYFVAVGSVRGFAFFLGLSTLLDLAVSYFFMHPVVVLLARRPGLVRMRGIGIAAGLDAREAMA
jgi:preprotein translocase subunit SecD